MSDADEFADGDPAGISAADATTAPDGFMVADTPPPESDDETFARLAKLPLAEYERARGAEAKRMGCRTTILDRLVGAARGDGDGGAPKQGRALTLPAPEQWPESVDGAVLLDRLAAYFARHVFLPPGAADAMAAWAVHTHCFAMFRHSPRLAFTSPEKRCGKTTALDTTALVCCKPLPTANVTAAAVFRTIEAAGPTLLIDEADTFLRDNEDLRGVLNAGHKAGGQVIRCVGDDAEPRAFAVFGPAAIAAIGRLPGTIADRAIEVRMKRATRAERPEPLRTAAEAEGAELARRCARWAADNTGRLRDADPALPAGLFNRAADNWRPLFAIARAAAGGWPERLAKAAAALAPDDADAEGRGVRLLADIKTIFDKREADRQEADKLASADLCDALAADATGQWADYKHGKPIGQAQLASVLKPFGIIPGTVRIGKATPKGYERTAFAEAWSRYLPAPEDASTAGKGGTEPQHRHNPQKSGTSAPSRPATATDHVAERNTRKPAPAATCGGVAASSPPSWRGAVTAGAGPTVDGEAEGEL
jgi:putative DNA primase/helicase